MICAQTFVRGVSVSQVARRYDVNANQVFNCLKDPRFASDEAQVDLAAEQTSFLPVEVVDAELPTASAPVAARSDTEIVIELSCGHQLRVSGTYDVDALARLIRNLSS